MKKYTMLEYCVFKQNLEKLSSKFERGNSFAVAVSLISVYMFVGHIPSKEDICITQLCTHKGI